MAAAHPGYWFDGKHSIRLWKGLTRRDRSTQSRAQVERLLANHCFLEHCDLPRPDRSR